MKFLTLALFVICNILILSQPANEVNNVLLKLKYPDGANATDIVRDVRVGYKNKHIETPEINPDGYLLLNECPDDADIIRVSVNYGSEILNNEKFFELKLNNRTGDGNGKTADIVLPKLYKSTVTMTDFEKNSNLKLRGVISYLDYNEKSVTDYLSFADYICRKSNCRKFIPYFENCKNNELIFDKIPLELFDVTLFSEDYASLPVTVDGFHPSDNNLSVKMPFKIRDLKLKVKFALDNYSYSYSWKGKIIINHVVSDKYGYLSVKNMPPVDVIVWNDKENFILKPDNKTEKLIKSSDISQFYIAMSELEGKEFSGSVYSKNISTPSIISSDSIPDNQSPGINVSSYSGTRATFVTSVNTAKNILKYQLSFYTPFFKDTDYSELNLLSIKPELLSLRLFDKKKKLIMKQLPLSLVKDVNSDIQNLLVVANDNVIYPLSFNNGIYKFSIYNSGNYHISIDTFNNTYKLPNNFYFSSSDKKVDIIMPDPMLTLLSGTEFYWVNRDRPGKINSIIVSDYANMMPFYGDKSKILRYWYKKSANKLVINDNNKLSLRNLVNKNNKLCSFYKTDYLLPSLFAGFDKVMVSQHIFRMWQGKYYIENTKSANILSAVGINIKLPAIKMKRFENVINENYDCSEIFFSTFPQGNEMLIDISKMEQISLPANTKEIIAYYPGVGKSISKIDKSIIEIGEPKEIDPIIISFSVPVIGNLHIVKRDNRSLQYSCDIKSDKMFLYGLPFGKYEINFTGNFNEYHNKTIHLKKNVDFNLKSTEFLIEEKELLNDISDDNSFNSMEKITINDNAKFIPDKVIKLNDALWGISYNGISEKLFESGNGFNKIKSASGLSILVRDKLLWHERDKIKLIIEGEGEYKDFIISFDNLNWVISAEAGYMSYDFNYFPRGKWKIRLISNTLPKQSIVPVNEYGGYAVFN